jgi:hypothetical protein
MQKQIYCSIAKISLAVNEILKTPKLLELDKKSKKLIEEKIIP